MGGVNPDLPPGFHPESASSGWPVANQGALEVDRDGLRRLLTRIHRQVDELRGSGRGGDRDFSSTVGGARGGTQFGTWLTAQRLDQFHGQAMSVHEQIFTGMLSQLERIADAADICATRLVDADQQSKQAFDNALSGVDPTKPQSPPAPSDTQAVPKLGGIWAKNDQQAANG